MNEYEYFPDDSIVINDIYKTLKDTIICEICNKVLRYPQICMKCQKSFCKKCIDKYPNKNERCPSGCDDPIYKDDVTKNSILSKTKYECKNCGDTIFYDEIQSHLNSNCGSQITTNANQQNLNESINEEEQKRLIKLQPEEYDRLSNRGESINYIKSKKYFFNNFIL